MMISLITILLSLFSILVKESSSALTAAIYDNAEYGTIVDIVDKNNFGNKVKKSKIESGVSDVIGITNDDKNNKYYVLSGYDSGLQTLLEYKCNSNKEEFTLVGAISATLLLSCLTSGPSGLYAVNILSKEVGKLDIIKDKNKNNNVIKWNAVSNLVGPYDAYVIAQDSNGMLHYINGDGKYYTSSNNKSLEEKKGMLFPTQRQGFCGDFIDDNHIVTSSYDENGGIVMYSLDDKTATQEFTVPAVLLNDVTRGPFCYSNSTTPSPTKKTSPPSPPSPATKVVKPSPTKKTSPPSPPSSASKVKPSPTKKTSPPSPPSSASNSKVKPSPTKKKNFIASSSVAY